MDEYVLNKIIEFKIKNDINTEVFMHEYYEYTYKNVTYVDIYFYTKFNINEIGSIFVDEVMSLHYINVNDNVKVCTYKKDELSRDYKITGYFKNNKIIMLDNKVRVDYTKFNFNERNLTILKDMKLKGFSNILVLPYTNKNYYICACGCASNEDECPNCGASKEFISLYDNEEKIIKTFAKLKYSLYKFESEDITYENEYFLNQLKLNYDILLDNSFFDELKEDSKIKLVEYKNRSKNRKSISIILVIIGIILLISIVVSSTIENKNTRKKNEKIISEYCESNEYKYVSLDKIVSNYKCSDYVYYLLNKKISNEDIEKIIESNNVEMYQKYYDVFKENLHSSYYKDYEVEETEDGIDIMDVESTITNITYLDYLYNNNYEMDDYSVDKVLLLDYLKNDLEKFTTHSKYITLTSNKEWYYASSIFNYCGEYNKFLNEYFEEYDIEKCNLEDLKKWSYNYHENSKDKSCFKVDLLNKDNTSLVYNIGGDCSLELDLSLNTIDKEAITNYYLAGGDMNYTSSYDKENFFHTLVGSSNINNEEFIAKAKLLYKYGTNVNQLSDSYKGKYTTLDYILEDYYDCMSVKNGFTSVSYVKGCNTAKEKYNYLKSIGAVCNAKCDNEKYFRR